MNKKVKLIFSLVTAFLIFLTGCTLFLTVIVFPITIENKLASALEENGFSSVSIGSKKVALFATHFSDIRFQLQWASFKIDNILIRYNLLSWLRMKLGNAEIIGIKADINANTIFNPSSTKGISGFTKTDATKAYIPFDVIYIDDSYFAVNWKDSTFLLKPKIVIRNSARDVFNIKATISALGNTFSLSCYLNADSGLSRSNFSVNNIEFDDINFFTKMKNISLKGNFNIKGRIDLCPEKWQVLSTIETNKIESSLIIDTVQFSMSFSDIRCSVSLSSDGLVTALLSGFVGHGRFETNIFCNLTQKKMDCIYTINNLDFQDLAYSSIRLPAAVKLRSPSKIEISGKAGYENSCFFTSAQLKADTILLYLKKGVQELKIPFEKLKVQFDLPHPDTATLTLAARVMNTTLECNAVFNRSSTSLEAKANLRGLNGSSLVNVASDYLPKGLKATGSLSIFSRCCYKNNHGEGLVKLAGENFAVSFVSNSNEVLVNSPTLQSTVSFYKKPNNTWFFKTLTSIKALQIILPKHKIKVCNAWYFIPLNWPYPKSHIDAFSADTLLFANLCATKLSGQLTVENSKWLINAKSDIKPCMQANARGWIQWDNIKPTGFFYINIPRFSCGKHDKLASVIPPISDDYLYGTFDALAEISFKGDSLQTAYAFGFHNASWENKKNGVKVKGINCTLSLLNFTPLVSNSRQYVRCDSVTKGTFSIVDVEGEFFLNPDTILISEIRGKWAGGILWSQDINIFYNNSHFNLDLQCEALQLQQILDWFNYKGVKASGTIYGHLPILVRWKPSTHFTFGNGFLEAQPQNGRIQISYENAKAILGIEKEINPKTNNQQEVVKLMMLNALQDIEYTKLRMDFINSSDNRLESVLEAKGYGPYGEKENRIPIGSLKVNVHALDYLLNSMLFSGIDAN